MSLGELQVIKTIDLGLKIKFPSYIKHVRWGTPHQNIPPKTLLHVRWGTPHQNIPQKTLIRYKICVIVSGPLFTFTIFT